ncbi:hypothetical protein PF002_g23884 [Phytophthora fragariae]|uniref:Uncharacterized protein n=1 Tax=Phytophthora fragariae TaxID=53985 RepID=A0A6A3WZP5_9STRA|nr:hypothetical protein PF002_g23884 [Phytophthora fragariae]
MQQLTLHVPAPYLLGANGFGRVSSVVQHNEAIVAGSVVVHVRVQSLFLFLRRVSGYMNITVPCKRLVGGRWTTPDQTAQSRVLRSPLSIS